MLNGTVPILPMDYIQQHLTQSQLTLLDMLLERTAPNSPEIVTETNVILDALGLTGVWGRRDDGFAYVRAFLADEERLFVHAQVYAADDTTVPQEVISRKWHWVKNPDEMFVNLMVLCKAYEDQTGQQVNVLAEDHPEMDGVGWRLEELNETWLIKREDLKAAMAEGSSIHPAALQMMNNATGRRVLGINIAKGTLTNILTMDRTLDMKGPSVAKQKRRAEERIRVDMMASTLSQNFMNRGKRDR